MKTYYREISTLRTTVTGKRWIKYAWWEDFGRDTSYAHSWGCSENRGEGRIWLHPGEDIYAGIARRVADY